MVEMSVVKSLSANPDTVTDYESGQCKRNQHGKRKLQSVGVVFETRE